MSVDDTITVPDTGRDALWHLGGLLRIRAHGAATGRTLAIVEEHALRGYRTPLHVHSREDETVYVIDGEVSYRRGDDAGSAGRGGVVFLPRNVPHTFEVASETAHFLVLISPAGFEDFFARVSVPARADRIPAESDDVHTDPALMAIVASQLGVSILSPGEQGPVHQLGSAGAAAKDLARADTEAGRDDAYQRLAWLLTASSPTIPPDIRQVSEALVAMLTAGHRPEPRAAILLGIVAERVAAAPGVPDGLRAEVDQGLASHVPGYLDAARRSVDDPASRVALEYLLAHFPEREDLIREAPALRLEPADPANRARLLRCLHRPDFDSPETLAQIGRSWPSPSAWDLSAAHVELDARWRNAAGLTRERAKALWEAETIALLAFMGAKADAGLDHAGA